MTSASCWFASQREEAVHLGEKVTLAMLERYHYWVGITSSVKWWIRRCYACQARKKTREMVRWPLVSLPLPSGPGQIVAFDLLGPLPRTNQGSEHVLLVVDLFSRHAEGYVYQLTRRRHKVAQLSRYTTTSRDRVALTLSLGQRSRVRVHGLPRNLPHAWGREEIHQQRSRTDQRHG